MKFLSNGLIQELSLRELVLRRLIASLLVAFAV